MFTRILFPTDFSDHARRAVDCIAGFPPVSEIILLHVTNTSPGIPPETKHEQEEYARNQIRMDQEKLSGLGLRVSVCLEDGSSEDIHTCIEAVTNRKNADLIVMTPGDTGFIRGIHYRSITSEVIHHSASNLLIIQNPVIEELNGDRYGRSSPMILSKVLFTTDLSPRSLEMMSHFSGTPGIGEMVLIHVIPLGEDHDGLDERVSQAFTIFNQYCAELKKKGIKASGDVITGDPVSTVLRYAEETDASVTCVVPSGKSRLSEIISGSFTCDLTEKSMKPVLILKNIQHL